MRYDFAVIGAGPAGIVVARQLQRSGLSVLLIDGAITKGVSFVRVETIGAATISRLKELDFQINALPSEVTIIDTIESNWRGELWSDAGIRNGVRLLVERGAFDRLLRQQVRTAGVELVTGKVVSMLMTTSSARLTLANGVHFDSAFVIDASGRAGQWARQQSLDPFTFDSLTSLSAVFAQHSVDGAQFKIEAFAEGWLVALMDADRRAHVSIFVDRDSIPRGVALLSVFRDRLSHTTLFRDYGDAMPLQPLRIWPATTTILRRCFSTRLLAIGDAAQTRDPLSGGGMAAAIQNASSAAEALLRLFGGDNQALFRHERTQRQEFAIYLQMRSAYYSLENRWPCAEFWSRRRLNVPDVLRCPL
jgi:flavin-dependent dehydrogenase